MKKSFLNSLVGLTVKNAEEMVTKAGFKVMTIPTGSVLTAIARPDTVILEKTAGIVMAANAGDPVQVLHDTPDGIAPVQE